jgi:hypothetical protein
MPPEIEKVLAVFWENIKKVLHGTEGSTAEVAIEGPDGAD